MPRRRRAARPADAADRVADNRRRGIQITAGHGIFALLAEKARWYDGRADNRCPLSGWAVVTSTGTVHLNPDRDGTPDEWAWVAAHCLLHLGFWHLRQRHFPAERDLVSGSAPAGLGAGGDLGKRSERGFDPAWNLAACLTVNRFIGHLGIGQQPAGITPDTPYDELAGAAGDEESWAGRLRDLGTELDLGSSGTGGPGGDLRWTGPPDRAPDPDTGKPPDWAEFLAIGLARVVSDAVTVVRGTVQAGTTPWQRALDWFVSHYPLLGAIADAFTLVEDAGVCWANGVRVAAISPAAAELYVNPRYGLTGDERRFVIAHELLHAGLRHDTRARGRDLWLWNVACDYVINGWLTEMGVGALPEAALYDRSLRGMSAEEVYDRIARDRRRLRKIATLRGVGLPDVLSDPLASPADPVHGVDLDEFYRRSLADGLGYHLAHSRGLLPAGLVEEIRALSQPPVPWDVALARWFDDHFAPLERRRSYARASRRQSATPDIPRPGWHLPEELQESRTFGVVLDTSGSMSTRLLGKALGAIASYAVSREVTAARVVFCDAEAHDNGWMHPLDIAGRVRVRGRGGTVLQPGISLLQEAADFPKDGPILIITDAACDYVRVRREHAFLIPAGAVLPFRPVGPVFRLA